MTKAQTAMLAAIKEAGVIEWDDILSLPNDRKQLYSKRNLNALIANGLIAEKLIQCASESEKDAYRAAHQKHTDAMAAQLKEHADRKEWSKVSLLADSLYYRQTEIDTWIEDGLKLYTVKGGEKHDRNSQEPARDTGVLEQVPSSRKLYRDRRPHDYFQV